MSTSHANFFSTLDLSLCARLFLSHVDLCPSRVDPFLHAGRCILMRIPILPTHGQPFRFSLRDPIGRFQIRFAWRADFPQADLCASREDLSCYKRTSGRRQRDLLRTSRRTLTTIITDLINWDS